LFNDRLEQRDLVNHKTGFHQIFRGGSGRHAGIGVQSGIGFRIRQGKLPWQPLLGAISAEIGDMSSFNGWQYGKADGDGRVNSAEVLSTSYKNWVNFGPLTPELTVMVWQPFMRQMGEIGETRSIIGNCIPQRMAGTDERICTIFTPKTCLVLRSYEFECHG